MRDREGLSAASLRPKSTVSGRVGRETGCLPKSFPLLLIILILWCHREGLEAELSGVCGRVGFGEGLSLSKFVPSIRRKIHERKPLGPRTTGT